VKNVISRVILLTVCMVVVPVFAAMLSTGWVLVGIPGAFVVYWVITRHWAPIGFGPRVAVVLTSFVITVGITVAFFYGVTSSLQSSFNTPTVCKDLGGHLVQGQCVWKK
jgi:hypothetical protein